MLAFTKHIDILKLAGVGSILGVDLTESRVRVVELENKGRLWNRLSPRFKVRRWFTLEFDVQWSLKERADRFTTSLQTHQITSRYAASTVESPSLRRVKAKLPIEEVNILAWITANYEKLLRLPVASDELSFTYEVLEPANSHQQVLITFVRREDVGRYWKFFELAGLTLVHLGVGPREVINALLVGERTDPQDEVVLNHIRADSLTSLKLAGGRLVDIDSAVQQFNAPSANDSSGTPDRPNILAGEVPKDTIEPTQEILRPMGLATEYSLAFGLGVRGFLSELNPSNLLSNFDLDSVSLTLHRSIAKRAALVCAVALFLALALPALADAWITSHLDDITARSRDANSDFAAVAALEAEVRRLEQSEVENRAHNRSSHLSRVLHELALNTPRNITFTKVHFSTDDAGVSNLNVFGTTDSADAVTRFMKNLTGSGLCSNVSLARSEEHEFPQQPSSGGRAPRHARLAFEVRGIVR